MIIKFLYIGLARGVPWEKIILILCRNAKSDYATMNFVQCAACLTFFSVTKSHVSEKFPSILYHSQIAEQEQTIKSYEVKQSVLAHCSNEGIQNH